MRQNNEVTLLAYIDSTDYNHVEKVFHKKRRANEHRIIHLHCEKEEGDQGCYKPFDRFCKDRVITV